MNFFSELASSFLSSSGTANNAAKIYLQQNGDKIQLPIPPSAFEVAVKQNNSTVNINSIGDLNMIGKTGLMTLSLSSFFPNQQYSFCQCTPDSPYNYISKIDGWRTSGKPCRITVTDTPINYTVTIDDFKWGEHDGSGDVFYTIDFREYKYVGGTADNTINSLTGLKGRMDAASQHTANTITVHPGDSLMSITKRALGQKNSLNDTTKAYLNAYKVLAKRGGLSVGNVLKVTNTKSLKVGDKNIQLKN